MAARIRKHHQDEVRARIQSSQLINVLEKHALGNEEDGKELSGSRLKAIEILLRKTIPDISAVQISNEEDKPFKVAVEWVK